MFQRILALLLAATACAAFARAADDTGAAAAGRVRGRVVDATTREPVEYVAVGLKNSAGDVLQRAATDGRGEFLFEHVPAGEYRVTYAPLGGEAQESATVRSDAAKPEADVGVLLLAAPALKMARMEVGASREAQHAIDRKSYVVGQDLKGASGSASDLLQSVPSVQVDIEGNVSLRGDSGVLILVDGKPSAFVAASNRANALAQMPAESIERIEVITNPSARYRPDGTAGIINLVLKRERKPGLGGLARVSVGTGNRATVVLSFNYRPRDYAIFGAVMERHDGRDGTTEHQRSHFDPATNSRVETQIRGVDGFRFHTHVLRPGFEYRPGEKDQFSGSLYLFDRSTTRTAATTYRTQPTAAALDEEYERVRRGDDREKSWEAMLNYTHTYAKDGPEFAVVARGQRMHGHEVDAYTNTYRRPQTRVTRDSLLTRPLETEAELSLDYTRPLPREGKLEAGYAFEGNTTERDLRRVLFDDATGIWAPDLARSNRFRFRQLTQAAYATFGRPIGKFGFLAGLRLEETRQHTDQATIARVDDVTYQQIHPTLHLSYQLNEPWKLQLNYSHRVNRPDAEQLNPFPDYQDPYSLDAGNPRLRPEETHSVESGVEYRKGDTTYLAAVYWRETYRAFTPVTRAIDAVTLLTTEENLGRRRAGGLELVATTKLGPTLSLNASANAFRNEIDASNLGFSARRAALTWDAKLNLKWRPRKSDALQLDTNYTARRLTAQGHRAPTFNTNLAWRHDFQERKYALTISVLDVFATAREHTVIDTPALREEHTRRRNARILYVGFVYNFGQPPKKGKDENIIEAAP